MQLLCCRTLWTNSHRFETSQLVSVHCSCSLSVTTLSFCVTKHCWKQQKQDEVRHMEELLKTFKEQAEQSTSKVCATMIVV